MIFVVFFSIDLRKFLVKPIKRPPQAASTAYPIDCSEPITGRCVARVTNDVFKEPTNTQAHRHILGVPQVVDKFQW
jgi:hypothetical protein